MLLFYKVVMGLLVLSVTHSVLANDATAYSASLTAMQGSWGFAPGALPAFVIHDKTLQEGASLNRTLNSLDFKDNQLTGNMLVDKDLHETCVVSLHRQAENLMLKRLSCKRMPVDPEHEIKLFKVKPLKVFNFAELNCAALQTELAKSFEYFRNACMRAIDTGKNQPYLLQVPNINQEKYQQVSRFISLVDAMQQKHCVIENESNFNTIFVCGR